MVTSVEMPIQVYHSHFKTEAVSFPPTIAPTLLPESTDHPLRIFLIQSAHGLYASSGGYRANIALARAMRSQGHVIKMLASVYANEVATIPHTRTVEKFGHRVIPVYRFWYGQIDVVALDADQCREAFNRSQEVTEMMESWLENEKDVPLLTARQEFVAKEVASFHPSHVIMNDYCSLKAILEANIPPCTKIFIVHDAEDLPFGPFARGKPCLVLPYNGLRQTFIIRTTSDGFAIKTSYRRLQHVDGLWAVSNAIADYFANYGKLTCRILPNHPLIYGDDVHSLPFYQNFDKPYICAINPGYLKGFPIVKSIMERMPENQFLIVKSWNILWNPFVLEEFEKTENAILMDPVNDMESLWLQVKVLLVPSLWYEAFGLVVIEALLRGIPVLSSNAGGLIEAHLGVPYVIPTNTITGERETDQELVKRQGTDYKIPENSADPWVRILRCLMHDRELYERIRLQSRIAAVAYVKGLDPQVYEEYMKSLEREQRAWAGKDYLVG
ncbi:hypothetical protein SpCBS45565_g01201 [Spizellomyces sp. 'palustris']|nr:hypothetical protein SpCBS45565_g01201 [Spizellomyces sp. 'palustris']